MGGQPGLGRRLERLRGDWGKYTEFNRKEQGRGHARRSTSGILKQGTWYIKDKKDWEFHYRAVHFAAPCGDGQGDGCGHRGDGPVGSQAREKEERPQREVRWMVDRLREAGHFERARYCISKIADPAPGGLQGVRGAGPRGEQVARRRAAS